jgi:protein ImuB
MVPPPDPAAAPRRHLALLLPALPVERLRRLGLAGPVLLWQGIGPRRAVVACDGVAGIRPGQALGDAQAVAPEAAALEADPAADALFLGELALWCLRFTPLVAVSGSDALLLDIAGAAHLVGGEAALLAGAVGGLRRLGVTAQGVIADAPAAALALARGGAAGAIVPPEGDAAAVAKLPLAALPIDPDTVAALGRLGLRQVEEARRQPRGPLQRRFGALLLRRLDEAAGLLDTPLTPIRPPPALEIAREFLAPLATRTAIDRVVELLLAALCRRLAESGRGARRVVLRAYRVDGGVQEVAVGTSLASRDPAHLARLFREKLERLQPGHGFERIALGAEVAEPLGGVQAGFAGTGAAAQREELARLFDRLGQRTQIWRLAPRPGHWPEREATRVAATAAVILPAGWPHAARPVRLLRRPRQVTAVALLPDAPPSMLRIGQVPHRVRAAEGPERLAPEWWRDRPGREMRDYYRLELASGARLWVCRVGLGAAARWFIHGHL